VVTSDPPTSQADRQTVDMRSPDRALHYCASRGKKPAEACFTYLKVRVLFSVYYHITLAVNNDDGCNIESASRELCGVFVCVKYAIALSSRPILNHFLTDIIHCSLQTKTNKKAVRWHAGKPMPYDAVVC